MKILLELSLDSHPAAVIVVGEVSSAPVVGDFVQHSPSHSLGPWHGYVRRRRWTFQTDGTVAVRCWLYRDPL